MSARVDELLLRQWQARPVTPAAIASDAEFLRRASLDLAGVVPRVSEVRSFLADDDPAKRRRLIDRLLGSSGYASHMATTWGNRILPQGAEPARAREAAALQKWLRLRFASNLRYDNLVGGLLLTGGGDELGPALYYRALDVAPEKIAASVAELFLGVKLHCAQCHDHPLADWSQRDFWGFAAFFSRVKGPDGMGMQAPYRLADLHAGDVKLPDSDEVVPPKYPRGAAAADSPSLTRRAQLVLWLTSRDNRFFSRAAVNWAWQHMFGRPLVASLEGLDQNEPAANEALLDELADDFVRSGFDLQALWRTLANTRAYQLSSRYEGDQPPPELFARMLPKPLTPEQLYDSFLVLAPRRADAPQAAGAAPSAEGDLDEDPVRLEFIRRMRPPAGEPTAYRAGTLQALMLMNGSASRSVTTPQTSGFLGALEAPFMTDDQRIEALLLATLARQPSDGERALFKRLLAESLDDAARRSALSDALWALLNSTEFAFNH
ncbi:MAG: DUF1549 domain-containing protein [Pirellulales bacterium]|nr:DUF1549 domain-containing protein [Pirellulales bacterium]